MKEKVTVQVIVKAPVEKVWNAFTDPKHIVNWNHASDDWHCPTAMNDVRVGGLFSARMESMSGDEGFDFEGVYSEVELHKKLAYTMSGEEGRMVAVEFEEKENTTLVTETFDAENENPIEMQKAGWQTILNNFRDYTEKLK